MHEKLMQNPDIEKAIIRIKDLIDQNKGPVLVAIDGRSGTGKSSIAQEIAAHLGGVHIVADDFWIGGSDDEWRQKSVQEKVSQAIDWQRIRSQVLVPLLNGRQAQWHPFNWQANEGLSPRLLSANPNRLIVLDGAYSSRPELQDIVSFSILVKVTDDKARRSRLVAREGAGNMENWHVIWDEAEDYYFSHLRKPEDFDMVLEND